MIKPALSTDFDFFYSLYFHPQINPYLLYEMMDKAAFQPIFNDLLDKKVLFIFETEGQNVGMFKLVPLTYRSRHIAYLGGVGIHSDFSGKGYGKIMLQAILDFGAELGLKRIELSVAAINDKAMHVYEKVGFQKEGILRNYTYLESENRYLDEVLMSYLYPIEGK
jgi:L-phenylalanine/L-methionine N-acetyltransferase